MPATLTTANSALLVTIEAIYPQAQRLQGYAADDVYDFDNVENAEFSMGIDGKLSAGFVFNEIPFTLTLQADSPSLTLFEQTYQYEVSNRTKLQQDLTITLPAVQKRYDLKAGFMRRYKAPSGKKILQPGVVEFVFARMEVSPL
jgi:tail fiber protein gp32